MAVPTASASAERLNEACGDPAGWACKGVLDLTDSEELADLADWLVDKPLRILLILLGAFIVARVAGRATAAGFRRSASSSLQQRLRSAAQLTPALRESEEVAARSGQRIEVIARVMQSAVTFVVYLIAVFMILAELGVDLAPLLAGAGVAGLAIGFGAQSLVKDFFAGIFILLEDQYAVGDIVDLGEATGVVENVSLRTTRLRSVDGIVWHVPNGEILRVGNMSQHWSRALLDIEVAYDTDLTKAKRLIAEIAGAYAAEEPDILEQPEVWGVEQLAASAIVIRLVVKTTPSEQWRISRELRERIKRGFDEGGIEIPFPQQTVWTRTPEGAASAGGEAAAAD
jgi:small conductance mechanosensitive channel